MLIPIPNVPHLASPPILVFYNTMLFFGLLKAIYGHLARCDYWPKKKSGMWIKIIWIKAFTLELCHMPLSWALSKIFFECICAITVFLCDLAVTKIWALPLRTITRAINPAKNAWWYYGIWLQIIFLLSFVSHGFPFSNRVFFNFFVCHLLAHFLKLISVCLLG